MNKLLATLAIGLFAFNAFAQSAAPVAPAAVAAPAATAARAGDVEMGVEGAVDPLPDEPGNASEPGSRVSGDGNTGGSLESFTANDARLEGLMGAETWDARVET